MGDDVVSGGAGFAGGDGNIGPSETVQESGFAGVGLADDGDDGERFHLVSVAGLTFEVKCAIMEG